MSAFQRKRTAPTIRGSRPSLQNGQLLVSSGNSSIDAIFSGGLPVGSVVLIEEDRYVTYSKALHRYFLGEGAVHQHQLLVANLDEDPADFIKKIPQPCPESSSGRKTIAPLDSISDSGSTDDLRIAWRYNALPVIDAEQKVNNGNYNFDLTNNISPESLAELDITTLDREALVARDSFSEEKCSSFQNSAYTRLLQAIRTKATPVGSVRDTPANLLRISISSLGSPVWFDTEFRRDLCLFLTTLKALVRNTLSVCCISMPAHLFKSYDDRLIHRIRNLVDYSIELESFAGSERETNPIFKEYHGLLYIRRLAALNSLSACTPETHDLAFKLRRKQFVVEKLHLPPELQDPADEAAPSGIEIMPSLSCASSGRSRLDF